MRRAHARLFVHLVWATWDRRPLLAPEIRNRVYRCIQAEAHRLGCEVYAIGGIEDHVHVLVRFVPTVSVAELVKQVKGASSRLVQTEIRAWEFFKWQGSYGAFTIAANQIEPVRRYIHNQAEHHRTGNLYRALERTDAET